MSDWTDAAHEPDFLDPQPLRFSPKYTPFDERPSLFNEFGARSLEGQDIGDEFRLMLKLFFREKGTQYRLPELEQICSRELSSLVSEQTLIQASQIKKDKGWEANCKKVNKSGGSTGAAS
jgi:hypothetical protein